MKMMLETILSEAIHYVMEILSCVKNATGYERRGETTKRGLAF
jgi:hypothetical protein